ncbi:MAG: hypothetical protein ACYC3W_11890 [Candidatus Nanopelagicales bacterium]
MMRRAFQAAVLVGALILTSGCAVVEHAGAVATVNGSRYTEQQLASDASRLEKALGSQARPATDDVINRNLITIWVSDQVMQRAVRAEGLVENKVAIGKLHRTLLNQVGGQQALDAFVASRGIAPNQLWMVLRNSVYTTDLGAKLIGGTDTNAQNAAAGAYLAKLASGMSIAVSPRFGAWDPAKMVAVAPANDLSKAAA